MRRTCTLNFIAEQDKNDLTEIDSLLSINKKIKLESGTRYNINFAEDLIYYPSIVDFPEKGEIGKIYVDQGLLKYYFWNQSDYVEIDDDSAKYSIFNIIRQRMNDYFENMTQKTPRNKKKRQK